MLILSGCDEISTTTDGSDKETAPTTTTEAEKPEKNDKPSDGDVSGVEEVLGSIKLMPSTLSSTMAHYKDDPFGFIDMLDKALNIFNTYW